MQTFTGRCLCGQSHFTVDVEMLDVYACHCTLCQKWSGGIAMYLEACGQPQLAPLSPEPPYFSSSSRGERYFCSGCGCPSPEGRLGFGINFRSQNQPTAINFVQFQ